MDHTMTKRTKRPVSKRRKHDDLDTVLAKIERLPLTSKRAERKLTATNGSKRVRVHDMGVDPYLVGINAKSEGKDPIKAIERLNKSKPLATRIAKGLKKRKAANHERVLAHEAKRNAVREPRPLPALPAIMEPPLPPRKPGDKPNVVALVYAFRAFQQFSHAHARRNLGNHDEGYYQALKERLFNNLKEIGIADMFDWSDFGVEDHRVRRK